ncbi:hypothetical protein K1X13_04580 [Nocardioides sp. WL0053]|uniref:Uncharacterized protein n=1 Tax=Nocardioides jiangsuensis TaxID=2866161 RepID=A0ABS7RJT4_9ACTN|nr:hypothetical protein [Nocardioides jiangsuensis]MBY9074095.1 hypothetical protein [Nocardioides jiangsuensis]
MSASSPRPRKHLMTPGAPRQQRADSMSLSRVQKWVMSTLAVTTIGHLAAGLVLAAMYVDEDRLDARIGLLVIAGAFGVISVVVALLIHGRKPLSPWLALGLLPTAVGAFLVF